MDDSVKTYQCPCCGAALTFDSSTQKLHCSHCDTSYDTDTMQAYDDESDSNDSIWNSNDSDSSWQPGDNIHEYHCPNCGAQLVTEATTVASTCAYCGSPVVLSQTIHNQRRPDYVIPFKIDKDAAKNALRKFYRHKILLPRAFSSENRIDKIEGIYVPFWLYSCDTHAHLTFNATRTRHFKRGDYDITETKHYLVIRSADASFDKIPVDGSSKMEDSYMDAIEPFDYNCLTDFNIAFLPGFGAHYYDQDSSSCIPRANARIKDSTVSAIRATCQYDTLSPRSSHVSTCNNEVKYALLPVWMLTTNWKGKQYRFALNGQSGRLVGDLPVDKGRFACLLASITIVLSIIFKLFLF